MCNLVVVVAYGGMRMQVSVLYTAPTAIRSLMAKGDGPVTKHKRSSLRILGTVGEPINPEAWRWYYEVSLPCLHTAIAQNRAVIAVMTAANERLGAHVQQNSSCRGCQQPPAVSLLHSAAHETQRSVCVMCVSHAGGGRQQVPNC